ncbi:MAG: DUF2169 domain-containing protein [Polyangiaceae bacterium]|nr:DUF2169 domain-containing protein [Polyangiaceae bacterium]
MILLDNRTPLDVTTFAAKDFEDAPFHTVVAKGVFRIERDKPLVIDETQKESLLEEDDLVPFKLGTDVLLRATSFAPNGKASSWCAGLAVGALKKYVTVTGPRAWMHAPLLGWSLTPAVPVNRVPLRYEFAYGGADYAPNPLGIGYVDPRKLDSGMIIPAPQILTGGARPLLFGKDCPVESFLPVPRLAPGDAGIRGMSCGAAVARDGRLSARQ